MEMNSHRWSGQTLLGLWLPFQCHHERNHCSLRTLKEEAWLCLQANCTESAAAESWINCNWRSLQTSWRQPVVLPPTYWQIHIVLQTLSGRLHFSLEFVTWMKVERRPLWIKRKIKSAVDQTLWENTLLGRDAAYLLRLYLLQVQQARVGKRSDPWHNPTLTPGSVCSQSIAKYQSREGPPGLGP